MDFQMSDAEPNYTPVQALGIIALSEQVMPPKIVDGKVTMPEGFTAEGHKACVLLARRIIASVEEPNTLTDAKESL